MLREVRNFAAMMDAEMRSNVHKGDAWRKMSRSELYDELNKHVAKLRRALETGDRARIAEHSADVGNCAMFIAVACDALAEDYRGSDPGPYGGDY